MLQVETGEEIAVAQRHGAGGEQAAEALRPGAQLHLIGDRVGVGDVRGADRGEVALVGVVRSFGVVDTTDELGNDEVEVRVALAVGVRRLVDRGAIDVESEIGAVVEIVTRKMYCEAFPSPLCTVAARPGTVSTSCAGR